VRAQPIANMIPPLLFLSPVLIVLEMVQLVVAERLLGVKVIQRGEDPRRRPPPGGVAALWSAGILINAAWMLGMVTTGFGTGRVACMLAASILGYGLRAYLPFRWTLVILTFEGAIRMGMHASLLMLAWRLR
jgi:hypothetical protein